MIGVKEGFIAMVEYRTKIRMGEKQIKNSRGAGYTAIIAILFEKEFV